MGKIVLKRLDTDDGKRFWQRVETKLGVKLPVRHHCSQVRDPLIDLKSGVAQDKPTGTS